MYPIFKFQLTPLINLFAEFLNRFVLQKYKIIVKISNVSTIKKKKKINK